MPLILPPDEAIATEPDELLDLLDALLLAGGSDIDPALYGAEPAPETTGSGRERDRFELALARAALERDLPVLGICRGMELLNVACGGTLDQHLADGRTSPPATPRARSATTRSARAGLARGAGRRRRAGRRCSRTTTRASPGSATVSSPAAGPSRDDVVEAIELPGPPVRARRPLARRGGAPQPR